MRRFISCLLVVALVTQCTISAFAEDESESISASVGEGFSAAWEWAQNTAGTAWDWVTDNASQAWTWTSDAATDAADWIGNTATDAWNWTTDAATDAWNWTSNAASDAADWIGNAATDAWNWTTDAATDAWHWTTGAANDAWTWTQKTAGDAWAWTCETAGNTWMVTRQAITGTWNDLFGELSEEGPHHLCISSPLFENAKIIGEWTDNDGIYTECFTYGSDYEITLIAIAREENILPPSVGEIDFAQLVASNFESAILVQDVAAGAAVRAMAQELRFKAIEDGLPVYGRALGVWTDHYIVCFVITSFIPVSQVDNSIDEKLLIEIDEFYDLWLETLSIYETRENDIETEHISDNIPAGI